MVTAAEIRERLGRAVRAGGGSGRTRWTRGSAPAELFRVAGTELRASASSPRCRTVLRRLRPGPADRRRADPQLPVRPHRVRSAHPAAATGPTTSEIAQRWVARGGRQAARPRHRRPELPAARPADVGHRRLELHQHGGRHPSRHAAARRKSDDTAARGRNGMRLIGKRGRPRGGTRGRTGTGSASRGARHRPASACAGPAVWIFGLFQRRSYAAADRQPLAEQTAALRSGNGWSR